MFLSKKTLLAFLFPYSFVLANVELATTIDYTGQKYKNLIQSVVQLEAAEKFLVYEDSNIRIEGALLSNKENILTVSYPVFKKNLNGVFEQTCTPTLSVSYGKSGTLSWTNENKDSFSIMLEVIDLEDLPKNTLTK